MKNGSELLAPHPLSTNTDKQGKVRMKREEDIRNTGIGVIILGEFK